MVMDTTGDRSLVVTYEDIAAAALLESRLNARGKRVGVIISGGNVDLARIAAFLK